MQKEWIGGLHRDSWVGGFWVGFGIGGLIVLNICIWVFTHFNH